MLLISQEYISRSIRRSCVGCYAQNFRDHIVTYLVRIPALRTAGNVRSHSMMRDAELRSTINEQRRYRYF